MGVPAFFRWLTLRCPHVLQDAVEPASFEEAIDNPEIDNLYLDMNGIIHPCTHPETGGIPVPLTESDMHNNIFNYIDKIVNIVRPQKLLYLAIDGVAPRAKMNQQRSRRFRAAQESAQMMEKKKALYDSFIKKGISSTNLEKFIQEKFDHTVITPGTEFMDRLSKVLQTYVLARQNEHPHFQHLKIVFSDSNTPGEGEHKILDFIRSQRQQPGYNANTRHCIYGMDADLIMLSLSTHEPHFYIFRETIMGPQDKKCSNCKETGHFFTECSRKKESFGGPQTHLIVNFQYIKIIFVRQFLELEFIEAKNFNLERIIDDWVFLCFLVGNDFLPHLPGLDIRNGGIDGLMYLYKQIQSQSGYLTENKITLEQFFKSFALCEEQFIYQQKRNLEYQMRNPLPPREQKKSEHQGDEIEIQFKQELQQQIEVFFLCQKEKEQAQDDHVQKYLQQEKKKLTYKQEYYLEKFHITPEELPEFKQKIKRSYIEGLIWNFNYYYNGCISWGWFYPFHYAPMASDLDGLGFDIKFEMGTPFQPIDQLMAVLSPRSSHAIPVCLRPLMEDPQSPIIDFYPNDFYTDTKGKKFAWMGEVLLPFIEEDRLLDAISTKLSQLSENENERNMLKTPMLYTKDSNEEINQSNNDISGKLKKDERFYQIGKAMYTQIKLLPHISENQVYCFSYEQSEYKDHDPNILENCILPDRTIDLEFLEQTDKKAYGGKRIVDMISNILGTTHQANTYKKRTFDQFNQDFNNNRSMYKEPANYKQVRMDPQPQQQHNIYNQNYKNQNMDQQKIFEQQPQFQQLNQQQFIRNQQNMIQNPQQFQQHLHGLQNQHQQPQSRQYLPYQPSYVPQNNVYQQQQQQQVQSSQLYQNYYKTVNQQQQFYGANPTNQFQNQNPRENNNSKNANIFSRLQDQDEQQK